MSQCITLPNQKVMKNPLNQQIFKVLLVPPNEMKIMDNPCTDYIVVHT